MADLKLNASHDIDFSKFILTKDNAESVSQKIKIRLLRYKGEYFKNTTLGIDYYGEVYGKTPKVVIDAILIEEILDTIGVQTLDVYESIIDKGVYQASFVATTTEGITFQFNIQPIIIS